MASQNRFLKFMASAKGRRFTFFGTCGASLTAFGVQYFPHTFLLFKHRELVASYREGAERPVSATLQERFNIAADYLKVVDFDKKFLKPFMVSGFDLYHIGSTKFRFGSLVGIPINYTYSSSEDIDKADMIVRGQPINWELAGGKLLEEALVLTEDEQIFGLARELLQLQDNRVLVNSLIASGSIVLYYCTTSFLNSKLMFFYKPLSLRVFLYNFVGAFVIGIYAFFSDFLAVSWTKTDQSNSFKGFNFRWTATARLMKGSLH